MSESLGDKTTTPESRRELLARLLREKAARGSVLPLSHGQQALWLLYRLAPESSAYNVAFSATVKSALDVGALQQAFVALTGRHEMLRVAFELGDTGPIQRIQASVDVVLEELDATSWSSGDLHARLAESCRRPFDLERGPVFRASLYRRSAVENVLLLTVHHIVIDGLSLGILVHDWLTLYGADREGVDASLDPLPARYSDFVRWQEGFLAGADGQAVWDYWQGQLRQPLPVLDLPVDRARPAEMAFRGATQSFALDEKLTTALRGLARKEETTLFVVLLAAFWTLLSRYSGQQDIVVGSPTAGRSRPEFESLVGYFVNPVVLRSDLAGDPSFTDLVGRARQVVLEALRNADFPFSLLVQRLNPDRDASRSPVFQAEFNLVKLDQLRGDHGTEAEGVVSAPTLGGLPLETFTVPQQEGQFDLSFQVLDMGRPLYAHLKYATDLFEEETIRRMAGHLQTLVRGVVERPASRLSELPLLTDAEREALAVWNRTEAPIPESCVHDLISSCAKRDPDRVALECGGKFLSYGELEGRSDRLARRLRGQGVKPGVRVGVFLERGLDMVVGVLGALKAGGAYVPLDPAYPAERLRHMLEDSEAAVLLVHGEVLGDVPTDSVPMIRVDEESSDPGVDLQGAGATPEDLAYVIYTSGSTGKPKGVAVTHRNLVNFLASMARQPGLGSEDVLLSVTTLSFDIAALELYLPLMQGGRVVMASREETLDGRLLVERLGASGATVMQATPATWRLLMEAGWEGSPGVKILCGGEALPRDLADELLRRGSEVWNMYGPTETTVWSSLWRVEPGEAPISIGRPIANTQMHVLDAHLNPQPVGVPGELYIGGAGVAGGYWERPELTSERFGEDPFSEETGARMYRTGDLAKRLSDGRLECLGRIDHQVKLRGFRIELGEIEAALESHEAVKQAVVVAREDVPGDRRLVGYVVSEGEVSPGDLRAHLEKTLPAYMAPSAFVRLESFPLTPNGKVDRKSLPVPEGSPAHEVGYLAPRTPTEEILVEIWSEVLSVERVGVEDDFFSLGGHSLLAAQVVSRVRKALDVELPLRELFASPTVGRLAEKIEGRRGDEETSPAPELRVELYRGPEPLSFTQQRLWFLEQVESGSAYVIAGALQLQGTLDVDALQWSLDTLVSRHESLRTTFTTRGEQPTQVVSEPSPFPLPIVDVDASRLEILMHEEADRGFDLERGPLYRGVLFRMGENEHTLLLLTHHIVSDAWSLGVLTREVGELYTSRVSGRPASLPVLAVQYRDFARWQREWLRGEVLERQVRYWRSRLEGAPQVLELPGDRPRPAVESHRGAVYCFTIPPEVGEALKAVSRREGATVFMSLLSAFAVLLRRYTGQDDLLVGTPIAGRGRPELDHLIGCFLSTLVLRADLSGDPTFYELLSRVRETFLDASAHADLPFERLVEELRPERDLSRNPLFQVQLVLHNAPMEPLELSGLTLRPRDFDRGAAQVDLTLYVRETPEGLLGTFEYATDLFEEETIRRMAGHLQTLVRGVVERPAARLSELPLLTEGERRQVVVEWNRTQRDYPLERCLDDLIEEQVDRTPERVAVDAEEGQLSYRDLDNRSNQLAHRLRRHGVGPGVLVGVALERSLDLVVALLATLKAGGAYVPLDPSYPKGRLELILEDAQVPVLLTQDRLRASLPTGKAEVLALDAEWPVIAREPEDRVSRVATSQDLAYVIFTSGSTGRPKGAMNAHRGIVNRLLWMQDAYGLGPDDRVLQKTPFSFDVSVWEFFWPLLTGARLVMARPEGHKDPGYLVRKIREESITTLHFVPAMLQAFLEEPGVEECSSLRRVVCSGEALPPEVRDRFFERLGCELHNLYGPTEAAVDVTYWQCRQGDKGKAVPIGRPVANTRVYVLDEHFEPQPVGVPGELHIGGVQVGGGYLGRPDLTAERFCPDPFSTEPEDRLYRTGDLARFLPDGNVEFLGRIDHQVKVRGFRIELGEIESVLLEHPAVRRAVVIVREDRPGDPRLVGYLEAEKAGGLDEELRTALRARLPDYMLPSVLVPLEALPLLNNGKVNRRALPAPEPDQRPGAREFIPPRTPIEETVSRIWAEVLGARRVSVEDSFFDVGGNSMLLLRVVARARQEDLQLEPLTLFRYPTVRSLAEFLSQGAGEGPAYQGVRARAQRQREALARRKRAPRRS